MIHFGLNNFNPGSPTVVPLGISTDFWINPREDNILECKKHAWLLLLTSLLQPHKHPRTHEKEAIGFLHCNRLNGSFCRLTIIFGLINIPNKAPK